MNYRELLLGCGHSRLKKMWLPDEPVETQRVWRNLTTLDYNELAQPDVLCDLNKLPWRGNVINDRTNSSDYSDRLALDAPFDEIHAYEVLEHLGSLGDHQAFFAHFTEIWRLLKPGGHLLATVPSRYSAWLWGDPSHRRAILPESLMFLDQSIYLQNLRDPSSPMSDFRNIYRADFEKVYCYDSHTHTSFILKAIKPSRWVV